MSTSNESTESVGMTEDEFHATTEFILNKCYGANQTMIFVIINPDGQVLMNTNLEINNFQYILMALSKARKMSEKMKAKLIEPLQKH